MAGYAASAETTRIATFAAPLSRDGPGLLLRDLGRDDPQIAAIQSIIRHVSPDILLLTDFDYDRDQLALARFAEQLSYPHIFSVRPNTGMATGKDLDQNGYLGDARDAQGYGRFPGDGGMALLSRVPLGLQQDLSTLLWRDLDGATMPPMPDDIAAIQRLSTAGHWVVRATLAHGPIDLWAYAATPPVFDGPEDRNGLRNRDELRLWATMMDEVGDVPFVILGNANLDPADGDGLRDAMREFLDDPRLQDPVPRSDGGALAADAGQVGDPGLDTADWPDGKPGNLRVSYVLPSVGVTIKGAGVFWPAPDHPDAELLGSDGLAAGVHRLVWVDIVR